VSCRRYKYPRTKFSTTVQDVVVYTAILSTIKISYTQRANHMYVEVASNAT